MDTLRQFLNSMTPSDQENYASRCGTTLGYLRKAISVNQKIGEGLCINLSRESDGAVRCEDLRPDVDWAFLRQQQKDVA
jgi:DNA-binding transcriptional regulator YdaS (Cro superfamily)